MSATQTMNLPKDEAWNKIMEVLAEYESNIERKIKVGPTFIGLNNMLATKQQRGEDISREEFSDYMILQQEYQSCCEAGQRLFMELCQQVCLYVKAHPEITMDQLERQFRQDNIGIYMIARTDQVDLPAHTKFLCGDREVRYQTNFVATQNVPYYHSEFAKFGYDPNDQASFERNLENLKEAGFLTMVTQDDHPEETIRKMYPNDAFVGAKRT